VNEFDFFSHISKRLGRHTPLTTAPKRGVTGVPDHFAKWSLTGTERVNRFAEELENLGGTVIRCSSEADMVERLDDLLKTLQPSAVGTWGEPVVENDRFEEVLNDYTVLRWGEVGSRDFAVADVGITGCDFAIADTGTVVLSASRVRGRSVHLLPSVHIAVVRESQVRTRMGEVFADLADAGSLPSSVLLVSGPSRSSDIENDLSIGVHGPGAVYALVVLGE